MKHYLEETTLLNYKDDAIQQLIEERGWRNLNPFNQIKCIYNFVKDEILFGYNEDDAIQATQVLQDGYGQCNTKGILFMALLRGVGIPSRVHGFTVDKKMQKGVIKSFYYVMSPNEIVHIWIEVYYKETWYNLEGLILDKVYLSALQNKFKYCRESFCGYGVATPDFQNPKVDWIESDTYIQKEAIQQDFGVYESPDQFFKEHSQSLGLIKKLIYRNVIRHLMNRNVKKIRES